jgi:hypothetical protein
VALSGKQTGVLRGMAAGLALTGAGLGAAIAWPPRALVPPLALSSPLATALAWDVAVVLCLAAHVGALARHRFFTPEDIDGSARGEDTPRARALQGALQNTLEQVALAVPTHLAWAALMPRAWQAAIPAAVVLFVVGRALFSWGFTRGAPARALGFALTFYPTVALLVVLAVRLLADAGS